MSNRDPRYFKVYQDGDDRELEQKIQQIVESGAAPGIDVEARESIEEIQRKIDSGEIGGGGGDAGVDPVARQEIQEVSAELDKKADKTQVWTMDNMGQDVKAAMTGGDMVVEGEQLYNSSLNTGGYWINATGQLKASADSKYAKIPVSSNKVISLYRGDSRSYTPSNSGALVFMNKDSTILSYINLAEHLNSGKYNDKSYATFTTPAETAFIGYTTKLSTTYDITETMLVIYGNEINKDTLSSGLVSLNGYEIKDKKAREMIAQTKPYAGVKLTAIGDSLTEKNARATHNYLDYIAEELGLNITNMGVSGTGYKRTDSENRAFYQRVLNINTDAQAVIVFGSFNDLGGGFTLGEVTDTTTDTICGAMNKFFDNYYSKLPTVPIGVISPTPWTGNIPGTAASDNYTDKLKQICIKRNIPYLDLYHGSNLRPWDANFRTLMYSKDEGNGVHPDENGHRVMIAPKVREFVKTLI